MHLILAAVWLVLALAVFLLPVIDPNRGAFLIRDTSISWGWLALAMSGYFVLRWWTGRMRRQTRETEAPLIRRRHRQDPPQEPIPEFMFDKPDEPESGGDGQPQPPSGNGRANETH